MASRVWTFLGDAFDCIGDFFASYGFRDFIIKALGVIVLVLFSWHYILLAWDTLWYAIWGNKARWRALRSVHERQGVPVETGNTGPSAPPGDGTPGNVWRHPLSPGAAVASSSKAPEVSPFDTLEELLAYETPGWGQGFAPERPRHALPPFQPLRSRLLVCHDLAGGYGEDRFVQEGGYDRPYRVYDWNLIDIFVYFSHHLVTIPPAGWTDVAHRHGTRVLGTFITEWDAGYNACAALLESERIADAAAARLTQIAVDYGFDGWLVNIENKVDAGYKVDTLVFFLERLTARMRASRGEGKGSKSSPRSSSTATVLWYDSVTTGGKLDWQNRLNGKNRTFFDACDGIFTNYHWKADYPSSCALEAQGRRLDVYMGIDTFGRGTWGGGGFDVDKALGKIRRAGVSAALFAPAWTMETQIPSSGRVDYSKRYDWPRVEREFDAMDGEFWSKIAAAWASPRPIPGVSRGSGGGVSQRAGVLPLVVNFGRGVGDTFRIAGEEAATYSMPRGSGDLGKGVPDKQVLGGAFYDLASQSLSTSWAGRRGKGPWGHVANAMSLGPDGSKCAANGLIGARYTFDESFDGSSSLCFGGLLQGRCVAKLPLFSCDVDLPAEPLEVSFTFAADAGSDMALLLRLDMPGELGGRREVVLRDWGKEGAPSSTPVFSKRLGYSETRSSYAPVRETQGKARIKTASTAVSLQDKIRSLRGSGLSFSKIGERLLSERLPEGSGDPGSSSPSMTQIPVLRPSSSSDSSDSSPIWTTRTYVVRDLRMGGTRAIRSIEVICGPGQASEARGDEGQLSEDAGHRLYDEGLQEKDIVAETSNATGGVSCYRASLGEVAMGPWRPDTPSLFRVVKTLRASEVAFSEAGGNGDGSGSVTVDLSLEWELEPVGGGEVRSGSSSVSTEAVLSRVLHWDLWEAVAEGGEGREGWRWLGRAYGRKFRVRGLREPVEAGEKLTLAAQQVNSMGYRQPMEECAKVKLSLRCEDHKEATFTL